MVLFGNSQLKSCTAFLSFLFVGEPDTRNDTLAACGQDSRLHGALLDLPSQIIYGRSN